MEPGIQAHKPVVVRSQVRVQPFRAPRGRSDTRADAVIECRNLERFRIHVAVAILVVLVHRERGEGTEGHKRAGRRRVGRIGIEGIERGHVLVEPEIVPDRGEPEFGMRGKTT